MGAEPKPTVPSQQPVRLHTAWRSHQQNNTRVSTGQHHEAAGVAHGDCRPPGGCEGELQGGQGPDDTEAVLLLRASQQEADLQVHQPRDHHLPGAEAHVLHEGEGPTGGWEESFIFLVFELFA